MSVLGGCTFPAFSCVLSVTVAAAVSVTVNVDTVTCGLDLVGRRFPSSGGGR